MKYVVNILLPAIVAVVVVGVITSRNTDETTPESPDTSVQPISGQADTTAVSLAPEVSSTQQEATTTVSETTTSTTTEPDVPEPVKQAIRSAEAYLSIMNFSEKGLIRQLEYEKFNPTDAATAVAMLEVDWNDQAAQLGADYLTYSAFSCAGLISQLEFEGFTTPQATFGAESAGVC